MKIYQLPSADTYSAQYYTRDEKGTREDAVNIALVVLVEYEGMIEPNQLGIKRLVQIDAASLQNPPITDDQITINSVHYNIHKVIYQNTPGIDPFYEAEIQRTQAIPVV